MNIFEQITCDAYPANYHNVSGLNTFTQYGDKVNISDVAEVCALQVLFWVRNFTLHIVF